MEAIERKATEVLQAVVPNGDSSRITTRDELQKLYHWVPRPNPGVAMVYHFSCEAITDVPSARHRCPRHRASGRRALQPSPAVIYR